MDNIALCRCSARTFWEQLRTQLDMASPYLFELNLTSYQQKFRYARRKFGREYPQAMRLITLRDKNELADLFFDAFGEYHLRDEQARLSICKDLSNYFGGAIHQPLLKCSWGYWRDETLIGACLLSHWKARQCALLDCIAVRTNWRSRNVSALTFQACISSLISAEQTKVCALISQENSLPVHLAKKLGFTVVESLK